ncbi:MAG: sodium-translocating pyrophosphatase [Candidatus Lindowbacteria bacterium RIFCSPLOWO2_12_FULL_62_27]|nr:MAG: sodium-translocating pyrophosphatase [Candidatus Lindowbacteria bacterium RIFCSPLOWO2_12_FULL_62_27]OGH64028.1 MAG: sodium-translocating pyrophosphatase [Candidatus Lindowbacteria bacterium RIFCSPLOWO2_02_FULL_62_12]
MINGRKTCGLTGRILTSALMWAVTSAAHASEAELVLPDLASQSFLGVTGHHLLLIGLLICILGMGFGFAMMAKVRNLPVHKSMRDVSELIYETCKTYLITQGKFLAVLFAFIGAIIVIYFGMLRHFEAAQVIAIVAFTIVGILGSYAVAWFGIRINTYANSRTSFAGLYGRPFPTYEIPIQAGMSVGMLLISVELVIMLAILLFIPGSWAGPCFIGFAIGESLGAAALRIAGGIFTKIADIGSDLMKIVFKIKEDDARNPGVIADCTGDNAGDSVGPTADGFETYGVTGVALITFVSLAINEAVAGPDYQAVQVQLLVWLFTMRIGMIVTSALGYFINQAIARAKYAGAAKFNFEIPLTSLVWITSVLSIAMTFLLSRLLIPDVGGNVTLWWKLSAIITCGTIAGALIPELVKVFTSTKSRHVREVLSASKEGGASLNILSGLVAGNFSAYWIGISIVALMAVASAVSNQGLADVMQFPAVFAFGLVAFGFLGMGPVTIAVDSYGPVTDNAQSVYELSLIEHLPNIQSEIKKEFGFDPAFDKAKAFLEENDGAGNTFKATAKPVLIGTAVVGATTLIFAIIMLFIQQFGEQEVYRSLSILNPLFMLGLVTGGAMIYWFTGASIQAVAAGAYRAVEFIKKNIKLEGVERASVTDSKRVVEICTQYAQKGMFNIFLGVFFGTLAFACVDPFFFVGYLISIAIFGLYQAIFMADAGGAWDNAKKIVETELDAKGTDLHAATVVGDTVGDPFKDTSSVSMNPVIKFTTLFGLLAAELAVAIKWPAGATLHSPDASGAVTTVILAAVFAAISVFFVYRSFYGMRITQAKS